MSWIGRTILFGDIPGGIGALLMVGGVAISSVIGIRLSRNTAALPILLGAVYLGFFGGFIIDVVVMDKVLRLVQTHSIVSQAPAVVACGIVGGIAAARWLSRAGAQLEEHKEQGERTPPAKHRLRRLLVLTVVTLLLTGYLVLPIARALSIAHPPRSAVCCATPADFGHPYEDVTIPSADGLKLHGWLVPSQKGAMVVVAHGFGSNRTSTLEAGSMLADHGFGVLWIDLLAHGESEGTLLTLDGEDVLAAVRYLQAQSPSASPPIGVWGFSLGGLEALQAACQTSAIGGVVADGPMPVVTSEDMPPPDTLADALWVPFDWVQLRALEWQGIRAHSSVRQALKDIAPRPVLLIAGMQNRGEARVLRGYATAGGDHITLWEIPEAGHTGGWWARRDDYTEKVVEFFSQALLGDSVPAGE